MTLEEEVAIAVAGIIILISVVIGVPERIAILFVATPSLLLARVSVDIVLVVIITFLLLLFWISDSNAFAIAFCALLLLLAVIQLFRDDDDNSVLGAADEEAM